MVRNPGQARRSREFYVILAKPGELENNLYCQQSHFPTTNGDINTTLIAFPRINFTF
jgi:hypothetical protein